jgi:hypothetical protein
MGYFGCGKFQVPGVEERENGGASQGDITSSFDFISWRRYAFIVSGILSILGLIAFVQLSFGHGNLGRFGIQTADILPKSD